MSKTELIKQLGNPSAIKAAQMLGYKDRQSIYQLPEVLTDRQSQAVIMRMKANGIKVPAEWQG